MVNDNRVMARDDAAEAADGFLLAWKAPGLGWAVNRHPLHGGLG